METDAAVEPGSAPHAPDDALTAKSKDIINECREMLEPNSIHAPHLDAMAGAREKIGVAADRLEGALLDMDIAAFHGLARSVTDWAGMTGGLSMDAPDYPELAGWIDTLHERPGVSDEDREKIGEWKEADASWREDRAEVQRFVERVSRVDVQRKEHLAGYEAEHDAGDHPMPAPSSVRMDADLVSLQATVLERRMDPGERKAHIRAAGGNPESIDAAVREIRDWIAVDDLARKMADRDGHIQSLHENLEALRMTFGTTAPDVPWKPGDALVPGDRLRWSGYGGEETEAIVLSVTAEDKGTGRGKLRSIVVEKFPGSADGIAGHRPQRGPARGEPGRDGRRLRPAARRVAGRIRAQGRMRPADSGGRRGVPHRLPGQPTARGPRPLPSGFRCPVVRCGRRPPGHAADRGGGRKGRRGGETRGGHGHAEGHGFLGHRQSAGTGDGDHA